MSFILSHWLALLVAWLPVSFIVGSLVGKMFKTRDLRVQIERRLENSMLPLVPHGERRH